MLARDRQPGGFAVPGVVVERAAAQHGQLAIYLDDELQAVLAARRPRSIDPAHCRAALRPDGNRPGRLRVPIRIRRRKDLRLRLSPLRRAVSGEVTTVVSVREGAVAYISKVDFEIRQAGRSQFRLAAPRWLGEDVEVQGEQIRQIRSRGRRPSAHLGNRAAATGAGDSIACTWCRRCRCRTTGTVPAAVIRPLDVERCRATSCWRTPPPMRSRRPRRPA